MTAAKPKLKQDPQIDELKGRLARALADYANLEKRFERDSGSIIKFANSNLLTKLLEVRDHLGMAAANGDTSLKMILATFDKLLMDEGVTEVKVDGMYDPATMECHETVPGEKNRVVSVQSRGYLLHGKLLRAARVTVGNGQLDPKGPESTEGQARVTVGNGQPSTS